MTLLKTTSPTASLALLKGIYDIDAKVVAEGVQLNADTSPDLVRQILMDWPDIFEANEKAPPVSDKDVEDIFTGN